MREGSAKMNNMFPRLQSEMPKLVTRSQSSNTLPTYLLRIQLKWGPQFRLVTKSLCSDYLQSDVGLIFEEELNCNFRLLKVREVDFQPR